MEGSGDLGAAWHALPAADVERRLETSVHGLSEAEAAARLARHGPNRLPEEPPPSALVVLLRQFRSPLVTVLIGAAALAAALGEAIDAAVIAFVLALNASIGFVQERKAEVSVRALMQLLTPQAVVVREGRERSLDSAVLVPGDLVLLESGTRVPADLRLLGAAALRVDESLLTGESLPVAKEPAALPADTPLADRRGMAFAGSIVASGRGRGWVVATGAGTELGEIALEVRGEERGATPLQRRMDQLARVITAAVAGAAALAFAIGLAVGESAARMLMVAVALAVAAIPEGLPIVLTVALAVGVARMARQRAIIRRLPSVETLGSTTVIGSDKTGTLTENRMTVTEARAGGRHFHIADGPALEGEAVSPGGAAEMAEYPPLYLALLAGVLASEAEAHEADGRIEARGDPTEVALLLAAARAGIAPSGAREAHRPFAEIAFESERRYAASIRERDGRYAVWVKGAPERVVAMCHEAQGDSGPVPLEPAPVLEAAHEMASRGLRVLAVAFRPLASPPPGPDEVEEPRGLVLLGLFGMMDPPRPGVREAIAGCRRAGIRVVMVTGDHAGTARAIGREIGLTGEGDEVLTGAELDRLDEGALAARLDRVDIYARVSPGHKLRVVHALKARGDVVAVTGDGVNDAPALRAADIGIAMGRSGTDVARESADVVLADDDFVSIYAAVREGRITFDNVRNATFFLVSTGVATVVVLLCALTLGWPLPLLPAQLLWLNLVTNGLQDVALAFEPGRKDVLTRPPRPPGEGVISALLWERVVIAGAVMAAGTLALFHWELGQGGTVAQARTVALTTLVLFQAFHVGNSRSQTRSVFALHPLSNRFLLLATAAALAVHAGALYWAPTRLVLRVEAPPLEAWGRMVAVAASILVAMEAHKALRRPRLRPAPSRAPRGGRALAPARAGSRPPPGPGSAGPRPARTR